jgi:hypothetical protein
MDTARAIVTVCGNDPCSKRSCFVRLGENEPEFEGVVEDRGQVVNICEKK